MKYLLLTQNGIQDNLCVQQNSGDFCAPDIMATMNHMQQYSPSKKAKRFRSAFTTDQVNYLEKQFKKFPYIGNAHRKEVAMALSIPERAVKIWFQNRRMKEKKETGVKEFDDEHGNRKSVEFVKDQLHNVTVPSANDRSQYSLPLLTEIKNPIIDKNVVMNKSCDMTIKTHNKAEYYPNIDQKNHDSVVKDTPLQNHKTSAEFSINLCKKYKTEPIQELEPYGKVSTSDIKQDLEFKPINHVFSTNEQTMPEDLSSTRKMSVSTTPYQVSPTNNVPHNSGYFSIIPTVSPVYAQPYVSPGGVIWKPINVMPVVSSSSPSVSPDHQLGSVTGSLGLQSNCNCNCHMKSPVALTLQQNNPNPQYIITALPFSNPSAKF